MFKDMDTDNSGNLSFLELHKLSKHLATKFGFSAFSGKLFRRCFETMDANKNGEVSFVEFFRWFSENYPFKRTQIDIIFASVEFGKEKKKAKKERKRRLWFKHGK